ncbi:STAS domain-containing protein [Saccharothrix algeriensis]|uniref:Anti-sigma factor antagonist n=1 Tax=Saccharothrix algeriensis TaxID=173560 RepID=A0A8T8I0Y5_9PSEU|nr:STAS domain-containing protein [Saccharothrix algeriensis]MBM7810295.1 anti-anti-sigma factor [Saccharothrix algeriensis]QTR04452.1 STAS domain-containing protein [Saccharothrix algeriensis]
MNDTASDPTPVAVEQAERDGAVVVRLAGEIDAAPERDPRDRVLALLARQPRALVLDLRRVTFFGSQGVALVVDALRAAVRGGTRFAVVADSRCVLRPLEITDVARAVDLHATPEAALRAVTGPVGATTARDCPR